MICHWDVVDRGAGRGNHGEMLAEQTSADVNLVCPSIRHALLIPAGGGGSGSSGGAGVRGQSQNITNVHEAR